MRGRVGGGGQRHGDVGGRGEEDGDDGEHDGNLSV